MRDFVTNILIVAVVILAYYLDLFDILNSKYTGWVIGIIILLLFAAALKILGNPFAKDDDDD